MGVTIFFGDERISSKGIAKEQTENHNMPEELHHIVDYTRHGISRPKVWNKPKAKTYDINTLSFGAYYQPMLEHIDKKVYMESLGLDGDMKKRVEMFTLLSRNTVELPTSREVSQMSCADLNEGPLRLTNFMNTFRAKQLRDRNSKSAETVNTKRTSTLVRDQYINMISQLHNEG